MTVGLARSSTQLRSNLEPLPSGARVIRPWRANTELQSSLRAKNVSPQLHRTVRAFLPIVLNGELPLMQGTLAVASRRCACLRSRFSSSPASEIHRALLGGSSYASRTIADRVGQGLACAPDARGWFASRNSTAGLLAAPHLSPVLRTASGALGSSLRKEQFCRLGLPY